MENVLFQAKLQFCDAVHFKIACQVSDKVEERASWRKSHCSQLSSPRWVCLRTNLVVPSMLVQEGDDGFNVVLLDNIQNLRTFD